MYRQVAFGVSFTRLAMVACWNSLVGYHQEYRKRYGSGGNRLAYIAHHHQVGQRFVAVTVNQNVLPAGAEYIPTILFAVEVPLSPCSCGLR